MFFCDLVGSSKLSSQLDPEELRELILAYQSACTSAIRRWHGKVARYVGDAILAYFCYPQAHEDDAERAVRAGLDVASAMATLRRPSGGADPLAARIGIATGIVIVGDLIGEGASEEQAVVGETPNLAARLQGLATPDSVVIAASTRALIGERFDCADLGMHALHGFADPVRAWRVLAPKFSGTRFEAAQPARVTPLVDREEEMAWLLRLWRNAERSRGRVALIFGEAGIGKSRVVEALREKIAAAPEAALRFQCSPHYVNTALHPVIEHIQRAAGIGREDTPAVKFEKLSAWLGGGTQTPEAVPLFGALLSIPPDARYALPAMSPQRRKQLTFELLLGLIERLASSSPLLMVFEDVHWLDPTTHEFLALLIERARKMRLLLVMTSREAFSEHVESRELKRLAADDAMALAEQVAGDLLPESLIDQVVEKTDGVPLFIEELTKAVLGAGFQPEQLNRDTLAAAAGMTAIPSTLHDSLMARLDQLGPAKHIAQVAGAIGREFSFDLLSAVVLEPRERLRDALQILERAGLVYPDPRAPSSGFIFKHALVQEAAYQSLLRSRRRELHLRIAEALEAHFPQTARDTPELIAHHWTAAGDVERAVAGWLAAGQRAGERSEYREAMAHLTKGLELVPRLADEASRRERELALHLALGGVLIIKEGGGTPEVRDSYARALELCEGTPESETHFIAHWGWWRATLDHRRGRERADKMLALAHNLGEPGLLLQAHHCQWATLYMLGAHDDCCRHIEAGLALYDPNRDRVHAGRYSGHDARVCGLGEGGLARWISGQPERGLELVHASLAWAEKLGHVGSRAHAMDFVIVMHTFHRDVAAVYRHAADLDDFAGEQKLRVFRARGVLFRGWARAMLQAPADGLSEMLEGIAAARDRDTPHDFPLYFEMLAEIYGRAGRLEEGLRAVADGLDVAGRHGIVYWNAELHRRRGELLLAAGDRGGAEASFQEALSCARTQDARSLALRAAVSLARVHLEEGDAAPANAIVRPLYESFVEGLDTPDLAGARQLLETLK